jgi:hypothetical protein
MYNKVISIERCVFDALLEKIPGCEQNISRNVHCLFAFGAGDSVHSISAPQPVPASVSSRHIERAKLSAAGMGLWGMEDYSGAAFRPTPGVLLL